MDSLMSIKDSLTVKVKVMTYGALFCLKFEFPNRKSNHNVDTLRVTLRLLGNVAELQTPLLMLSTLQVPILSEVLSS